nr:retrovirus-related Pol polyprotein from transposon TNT 1-94 [Tanacetum cinerariifolium]
MTIDIEIEDDDQALMLLTLLPSSYENFVDTLLYERQSLIMEDVLATLNSRKLKKRIKGIKEETSDGLYVKGRAGTGVDIINGCMYAYTKTHSEPDLLSSLSGPVRKGKRDQDSNSSDDEGNAYFGEALVGAQRNREANVFKQENERMAGIQLGRDTQLNTDGQTIADQPQAQLKGEAVRSQPINTMGVQNHDQGNKNQAEDSGKKMGHMALDATSEAAISAKDLAQDAATKTANIVRGENHKEQQQS